MVSQPPDVRFPHPKEITEQAAETHRQKPLTIPTTRDQGLFPPVAPSRRHSLGTGTEPSLGTGTEPSLGTGTEPWLETQQPARNDARSVEMNVSDLRPQKQSNDGGHKLDYIILVSTNSTTSRGDDNTLPPNVTV